ncbi:lipocalin family protein, partial [Pseudomonas sp. NPDC089401]|uniref:lipocalin family protein n=1 Tax=Pseudomonas sp. NPDC089401 TaxID=3364462 RepID=UPI0037F9D1FD
MCAIMFQDVNSVSWHSFEQTGRAYCRALKAKEINSTRTRGRVSPFDCSVGSAARSMEGKAWMGTRFPYWEGSVRVTGSGQGRGYLEMTGYLWGLVLRLMASSRVNPLPQGSRNVRTSGDPVGAGLPAVQTGDIVYIPNRGHGLQANTHDQ